MSDHPARGNDGLAASAALLFKACEVHAAWCLRAGEFEDCGPLVGGGAQAPPGVGPAIRSRRGSYDGAHAHLGAPGVAEWAQDVARGVLAAAADGEAAFRTAVGAVRAALAGGSGGALPRALLTALDEPARRSAHRDGRLRERWPAFCLPTTTAPPDDPNDPNDPDPDAAAGREMYAEGVDNLAYLLCCALGSVERPGCGRQLLAAIVGGRGVAEDREAGNAQALGDNNKEDNKNKDNRHVRATPGASATDGDTLATLLFMYRLTQAVGLIPLTARVPACRAPGTLCFNWHFGADLLSGALQRIAAASSRARSQPRPTAAPVTHA
jgi:hypothetical protein